MGFTLPETLPTDPQELRELRNDAVAAFRDVYREGDTPSEAELDAMNTAVEAVERIDEALRDVEGAEQRAAGAEELARRLTAAETAADDDGGADGDGGDTAAEEEPADVEPAEESAEDDTADVVEPVAAAARPRTSFANAARGTTPQDVPAPTTGWRLTTSARNFETGIVDSLRVAREFTNLATGRAGRVLASGGRSETTLAYLDREMPAEFTIRDEADAVRVLDEVTDESRLPGGALTAAGGWCSPSETVYEFLPTAAPGDLLSLPEVSVARGGVRFPVEPDFASVYNQIGFHQTEAQAQAGTEKTCFEVPCGEFEELRLDVQGVCITAGILQDKAWPELTRKYVDEALRLHQHKVNAWRIAQIIAGSTAVTGITGVFGTAGAVLATLELQVADMRARHRIPSSQSVEGIAPVWLLSILRADLALRDEVLPEVVTDERVREHFRNLGANLQFVADWQNDVIGGTAVPKAWPDTVDVILYPAGTWYSALEPVINLGVTYDAAMLKTNRAVQLFTEDGVAVGKRGPESRLVTIPVAVNGEVGARHAAPAAPAGPAA